MEHVFVSDDERYTISTSNVTSTTEPIIIEETEHVRLSFNPKLVDNPNASEKCIEGYLIFEKKQKKDSYFPSDNKSITRRDIKVGDSLRLQLKTEATYKLYQGLQDLYGFKTNIGTTEVGFTRYKRVDTMLTTVTQHLKDNPGMINMLFSDGNFELVKTILDALATSESVDKLKNILKTLDVQNLDNVTQCARMAQLEKAISLFEQHLDLNDEEEFWQKEVLEEYSWILGQIFSLPCMVYQSKAYVGGKGIQNSGGNVCDFLCRNTLTRNVAIIEIKRPSTKIIHNRYRHTYSFTSDFTGAVNQVLNYRESLNKDFLAVTDGNIESFNPTCVVLIGRIKELIDDKAKLSAFENYRSSLNNIIIITFDELLEKMKGLLKLMNESDKS